MIFCSNQGVNMQVHPLPLPQYNTHALPLYGGCSLPHPPPILHTHFLLFILPVLCLTENGSDWTGECTNDVRFEGDPPYPINNQGIHAPLLTKVPANELDKSREIIARPGVYESHVRP